MREQLEQRLDVLKGEFESGQKMLMDLRAKEEGLKETLLRISGAIQVLEELLGKNQTPEVESAASEAEVEATS